MIVSCKCYWNNLDHIQIVIVDGQDGTVQRIKISHINRKADGGWEIRTQWMTPQEFTKYSAPNAYHLSEYTRVPDYIFRRAFSTIYTELLLQFKLNGEADQLAKLDALFTLAEV
jgi:hypothetical protein